MEVSRKQLIELIRIAKNEVKGSSPRTPTQLAKAFENSINGRNEPEQGALSENKEVTFCQCKNHDYMDKSYGICGYCNEPLTALQRQN